MATRQCGAGARRNLVFSKFHPNRPCGSCALCGNLKTVIHISGTGMLRRKHLSSTTTNMSWQVVLVFAEQITWRLNVTALTVASSKVEEMGAGRGSKYRYMLHISKLPSKYKVNCSSI